MMDFNPPTFEVNPHEIPMREKTWADHDAPWCFASYHLSERQWARLEARKDAMIAQEWERG